MASSFLLRLGLWLYYPFLMALCLTVGAAGVGLIGLAWKTGLWLRLGVFGAALLLDALLFLVVGCVGLFQRVPIDQSMELKLPRKSLKGLYQLVEEVADRWELEPPDEIRFGADTIAHVYEDDDGDKVLVLGGWAVATFSREELAGIIAHELAHFTAGDTRLSRQAAKGFQTMGMLERWLDQSAGGIFNPIVLLVVAYHRLFLVLWAANSRQQEYAADQYSLRQTGKKTAARSLVLVTVTDHLPWARLTSVLDSCVALKQPLDRLFAEQVQRLRGTSAGEWQEACRRALKRETGLLDTHPALKPRLAALGMSSKKARELAQAPSEPAACESIPGWPAIERDLTIRLLAAYQEVYQAKMDMAQIILGKPIER